MTQSPDERQKFSSSIWKEIFSTIRLIVKCSTFVIIGWMLITSLTEIALNQPESLDGLAKVFEYLKFDNITLYVLCASGIGYGLFEHRQKKRIIAEKGKIQKELEGSPAWRTSSGLTDTGDNPGE